MTTHHEPITAVDVTPIAIPDPPLLNSTGVHEPLALRIIVQVHTGSGATGLGECQGGAAALARLESVAPSLVGLDVHDLVSVARAVDSRLTGAAPTVRERSATFSAFEVACLDAQGQSLGLPVSTLLGGARRDRVPYAGYLFYKWSGHPGTADAERYPEALDPAGLVAQATDLIDEYGFRSLKLKGGVFPPAQEIAALQALAAAFPDVPLRIDPNCAWTVGTSVDVARQLDGIVDYLEDPARGLDDMVAVARQVGVPLASNMAVESFDEVRAAIESNGVQIVLGDHHYFGGLRASQHLAAICDVFGLGLAMHSNSHLGISLAAMTHLAATFPTMNTACDTHYPWNREHDVIAPGDLVIENGSVAVPTEPGLGVRLVPEKLAELHELFRASGRTRRDDTGYRQRFDPTFDPVLPRW